MTQDLAHVIVKDEKILVLRRTVRVGVRLKRRKGGEDGVHLISESAYLAEVPSLLHDLKSGKVVRL